MKNKLLFLSCLLFAVSHFVRSQDQDSISKHFNSLKEARSQARKQKNYERCVQLSQQSIDLYEGIPKEKQKYYKYNISGAVYDLACYYSLTGKKEEALVQLQKAIDLGRADIQNILEDPDLDPIRTDPSFSKVTRGANYLEILQDAPGYTFSDNNKLEFSYMSPDDPNLIKLRLRFNLDSIAGNGDEFSRLRNLMLWVHNTIPHNGSSDPPSQKNALELIEFSQREKQGVNCRMLATILNECYLAMGFKSRFVTCMPKVYHFDCHVINAVYSTTLNKWLWMDPTMNAYVTDENGTPLSIPEVRRALRQKAPVILNKDANWNNKIKQTKEHYLDYYMAKNLYYFSIPQRSEYNTETHYEGKIPLSYIQLTPLGYRPNSNAQTTNEEDFWQSPYQ